MRLSQGEIIALVGTLGAVVLTAIIHIGIREWYQPDLRYELGGYYIAQNNAVTSLRMKNHGHSDAEGTILVVNFGFPIQDISVDSRAIEFKITSGKIGDKVLTIAIDRLVPGQSMSMFFAIDHGGVPSDSLPTNFLRSLTFKGGQGKTGLPIWANQSTLMAVILLVLNVPFFLFVIFGMRRWLEPHYDRISEMIDMALDVSTSGASREDLAVKAEAATKRETFRKRTLQQVALRVFDASDRRRKSHGSG